MLRKKKIFCVLLPLIALLLLIGSYMLRPHSFADLQPDCDSVLIFRTDTAEDFSFTTI